MFFETLNTGRDTEFLCLPIIIGIVGFVRCFLSVTSMSFVDSSLLQTFSLIENYIRMCYI